METKKERMGILHPIITVEKPDISRPDDTPFRGSIVNKEKAGLLTCNIYIILPRPI